MTIALRDYQLECLETVLNEAKAGVRRQLLSLPTGAGKTILMSAVARAFNKKTLLLAHREELITQAYDKFRLFWPEASIGICMADRDEIDNQIVIGSIQSVSRPKRLERLLEKGFDVLMVDEAHHVVSDTYQTVIDALGFPCGTNKLLIGVTATPHRSDKQPLGTTFDKITFSRSIGTMIKAGYLSPVIGRKILTSFVLERLRSHNGDFSISELAEIVNTSERNAFIVDKFKAYAHGRKGIAFCCDVQHCQDLAEAFIKQGIPAAAVWGDMVQNERKQAIEDLKNGKIQIATSCGVLLEGFDEPSIDAVIMARPTKSASLYIQAVGRGLRLWPGKQNCLVLDFCDKGHNLDSVMTLSTTVPDVVIIKEEAGQTDREEIDNRPKIEVLDEMDREFDILGSVRFIWAPVDDEWSLLDDEKREIIMSPSGGGFIAMLYYPNGNIKKIVNQPLPLEYCAGVCEDYARRNLKIAFANPDAPWMSFEAPPTKGQLDFLEKNRAYRAGMSKGECSLQIRKIIAQKNKRRRLIANDPITDKQMYFLKHKGIDTKGMTKVGAMQAIAQLKKK